MTNSIENIEFKKIINKYSDDYYYNIHNYKGEPILYEIDCSLHSDGIYNFYNKCYIDIKNFNQDIFKIIHHIKSK